MLGVSLKIFCLLFRRECWSHCGCTWSMQWYNTRGVTATKKAGRSLSWSNLLSLWESHLTLALRLKPWMTLKVWRRESLLCICVHLVLVACVWDVQQNRFVHWFEKRKILFDIKIIELLYGIKIFLSPLYYTRQICSCVARDTTKCSSYWQLKFSCIFIVFFGTTECSNLSFPFAVMVTL